MDTSGNHVKKRLGLDNLPFVKIARLIGYSISIYLIFYDTRRPHIPLTTRRILKAPMPTMAYRYPFKRRPPMTPPRDIEDWNGEHKNALFFSIDLAGYLGDEKELTRIMDSSMKVTGRLQEFVTLSDLKSPDSSSDMTKRFSRERRGLVGGENIVATLVDVVIDEGDKSVTFQFLTDVTPKYPPDYEYQEIDPENNFRLQRNPSKSYELQIKILDFFDWLDTRPEDAGVITQKEIKEILEASYIQVFNTSPAWHWQSHNWNLSQVDASIHPTSIAPEFWNQSHLHGEDAFLDKHLYGLFRQISFFEQQMASMLSSKLRQRDLI